jgi:pilus assembly protein CpaE
MTTQFLVYYHSPESGQYLEQIIGASGFGKLLAASDLKHLPTQETKGADVILVEHQEGNPELDRWIEDMAVNPKNPPLLLYFPEISTTCLWKALRLGARECFSYPIKTEEFREAVDRALSRASAALGTAAGAPRIVSFLGCKGGVGTTFLAINCACLMARERQGQVLLLDLDLQYGQLSYFFDIQPQQTLGDAVNHFEQLDAAYLQSILYPWDKQLQILPAPASPEEGESISPEHVEKLLGNAKKLPGFSWVIIDAGHRFDEVTLKAVELSDQLILVATPTIPALSNAKKLLELLRLLGLERLSTDLWLNAWQKDEDLTLEQVSKFLEKAVSGTVRYDYRQVARSINEGRPLAETDPRHPVCQDLKALVAKIKGEEAPANGNGLERGWLKWLGGKK